MAKNIYEMFKTDAKKELEGIILDYGEAGRILVARAGGNNKQYARKLDAMLKPYAAKLALGMLDEDIAQNIYVETYAHTIVLDLEGFKDADGKDIRFTRENVIKLFTELPDLFKDVRRQCENFQLFKPTQLEEDSKNSEPA